MVFHSIMFFFFFFSSRRHVPARIWVFFFFGMNGLTALCLFFSTLFYPRLIFFFAFCSLGPDPDPVSGQKFIRTS